MTPVIRTERLQLEPYVSEDEEDFVRLFADEEVARWMGDGPQSEEENRALFGRVLTHIYPTGRFDVWAVREDGRLVGHAEIKDTTDIDGHEIIYALARRAQGRGLGTELASALVSYGFGELGLSEVHATVAHDNAASLALLEKLGFSRIDETSDGTGKTSVHLSCNRDSFRPQ